MNVLNKRIFRLRNRRVFRRQELHMRKRLADTWRRPKGKHSKLRVSSKINPFSIRPRVGYGTPRVIRGLHPSGLEIVRIHNVESLNNHMPNRHILQVGRTVSRRNYMTIYTQGIQLGFRFHHPRPLR